MSMYGLAGNARRSHCGAVCRVALRLVLGRLWVKATPTPGGGVGGVDSRAGSQLLGADSKESAPESPKWESTPGH